MIELKSSYTFKEIIANQKKTLDEKIEAAVKVLEQAKTLSKHNIAIAFSGGKDSEVVADLIERFLPDLHKRVYCIFGNTSCEFPESLMFARKYGSEHYGERFIETKPMRLKEDELRYDFAKELIQQLEDENALDEVLKPDGKLKGQKALIQAAEKRGYVLDKSRLFKKGHIMNFVYCLEQYGAPLLGKAASKLDAHRINIECFLKYSNTASEKEDLRKYYDTLSQCKFSQHCCTLLKKKPSERAQAEHDVDIVIKGLMAAESHTRMVNVATRGHIFESHRPHIKNGSFYHVSPLAMWTDDDIWEYIHRFKLEYSPLYDIEYTAKDGSIQKIKRNGCMFCGTDIQFKDNHLSVLRQTHPKAYQTCMVKFGYIEQLSTLYGIYKSDNILSAYDDTAISARLIERYGSDGEQLSEMRPCAFDDFGEMVDIQGTGLENEYDPEND